MATPPEAEAEELSKRLQLPLESVQQLLRLVANLNGEPGENYRDLLVTALASQRAGRNQYLRECSAAFVPPNFPSQVQIQTIAGCNAKCPMCAMSDPEVRARERGRMSPELFRKIVEECSRHPECEEVALYLQNEPLLDAALGEKIALVKELSRGRLRTRIVTNGILLSRSKIAELIDAQLDAIAISVNAFSAETYRKVMGGLDLSVVTRNVDMLLDAAPPSMLVTLTFMITSANEHEIQSAVQYWSGRGVYCGAYGINTQGGMVPNFDDVRSHAHRVNGPKECYLPLEDAAILCNGDILLCCTDWSRGSIYGSVGQSSLHDVWHSPALSSMRRAALFSRFPARECATCSGQTRVLENLIYYGGSGGCGVAAQQ